jgi:hypothetical protein
MTSTFLLQAAVIAVLVMLTNGFMASTTRAFSGSIYQNKVLHSRSTLQMNFFEDAVRFFSNMKKEASAKHILIKGPDAVSKLSIIKGELEGVEDLSAAFSDLAAKVNLSSASMLYLEEAFVQALESPIIHIILFFETFLIFGKHCS